MGNVLKQYFAIVSRSSVCLPKFYGNTHWDLAKIHIVSPLLQKTVMIPSIWVGSSTAGNFQTIKFNKNKSNAEKKIRFFFRKLRNLWIHQIFLYSNNFKATNFNYTLSCFPNRSSPFIFLTFFPLFFFCVCFSFFFFSNFSPPFRAAHLLNDLNSQYFFFLCSNSFLSHTRPALSSLVILLPSFSIVTKLFLSEHLIRCQFLQITLILQKHGKLSYLKIA